MYMEWCNGTYDIFFGIDHRLRREDMEETFKNEANEARMEVCSRRSKIHSPTRMQTARIASRRRVEFRWRLVMDRRGCG